MIAFNLIDSFTIISCAAKISNPFNGGDRSPSEGTTSTSQGQLHGKQATTKTIIPRNKIVASISRHQTTTSVSRAQSHSHTRTVASYIQQCRASDPPQISSFHINHQPNTSSTNSNANAGQHCRGVLFVRIVVLLLWFVIGRYGLWIVDDDVIFSTHSDELRLMIMI